MPSKYGQRAIPWIHSLADRSTGTIAGTVALADSITGTVAVSDRSTDTVALADRSTGIVVGTVADTVAYNSGAVLAARKIAGYNRQSIAMLNDITQWGGWAARAPSCVCLVDGTQRCTIPLIQGYLLDKTRQL